MRLVTAGTALAAGALVASAAPAAMSAPPVLTHVGAVKGHITARWSLPAGAEAFTIEVSATRRRGADGGFAGFPDFGVLSARQTSWRSRDTYRPGTYYVHVSAYDENGEQRWSNTKAVWVRGIRLRGGTYRGTTSQGQRFELQANGPVTRVTRLKFGLRSRCGGSSRSLTYNLTGSVAVTLEGSFRGEFILPAGLELKGTFRARSVTGMLRQDYFDGNLGARCDSGVVRFSARRS